MSKLFQVATWYFLINLYWFKLAKFIMNCLFVINLSITISWSNRAAKEWNK